jgi:hypothetical protein
MLFKINFFIYCYIFISLNLVGQEEIYKYSNLKPDFIQKWSSDSIEVKFKADRCLVFSKVKSDYNKAKSKVYVEITNKTGRDLVYKTKKTVDVSIRHLAEWLDRLFNDATNGSRSIDIVVTKELIKGKDTLHVFPKNQTWVFEDKITLMIPTSRNIDKYNYYPEHTGTSYPLLPKEASIIDGERQKEQVYLEKKFKSAEKNNSKTGKVMLQFDMPLFKKYYLYINDQSIGLFQRGDYYSFDFKTEQKVRIKLLSKKMKETDVNHEFTLKPGYDHFFTLHTYNFSGKMAELFSPNITIVNSNYIPKALIDKGITKSNFTPAESAIRTGQSLN